MTFEIYAMQREIKSQPEAWAQAVDAARSAKLPEVGVHEQAIFTRCGSTYYLSLAAAALYQELTGSILRVLPGGELLLNPLNGLTDKKILLAAMSRSGTTNETVKAVKKFKREKRGKEAVPPFIIPGRL